MNHADQPVWSHILVLHLRLFTQSQSLQFIYIVQAMHILLREYLLRVQGLVIDDVVTVSGDVSIKQAIEILYNRHIGSVIIIDDEGRGEGIFTERDAIRIVATDVSLNTPLKKVMTTNLKTVPLDAKFSQAKRIMDTYHIRHLPVVDEQGRIVGLLSIRTILDELFGAHTATT